MGAFLDTPNTAKETEDYTDKKNGLVAGVSCMQGWRIDMEVRGLPPAPSIIHHPSSQKGTMCTHNCSLPNHLTLLATTGCT